MCRARSEIRALWGANSKDDGSGYEYVETEKDVELQDWNSCELGTFLAYDAFSGVRRWPNREDCQHFDFGGQIAEREEGCYRLLGFQVEY